MTGPLTAIQSLREELTTAISGMVYLSESESELELLPADTTLSSQETVAKSIPGTANTVDADTFLDALHASLDPGDDGLAAYGKQWDALFELLKRHTTDIRVYRSGSDPVEIRIAAILDCEAVIVRTTAVET